MPDSRIGFCVIYRWKVDPVQEDRFLAAWETLTHAIREKRGGLGSRLHRDDQGWFVAYAQWPDRETWERSQAKESADPGASAILREAVVEADPPMGLDPVRDLLVTI